MAPGRVLVTGAGGFVGANLVRRLAEAGHETLAMVRPGGDPWRLDSFPDARVIPLDLRDGDAVAQLLHREQPDAVFHLAAYGAYSRQQDSRLIAATDYTAFVTLVEACEQLGVPVLVNAGSSSEYGVKSEPPTEDASLEPSSDYAVAKAAASLYARHVGRERGYRVVTLRLYSVYGPWEDPARFIPTLLVHARRGELPPLVAPHVAHDFIHVDDVVDAFLLAAAKPAAGAVYNVGSGTQTTIEDVVGVVSRIFGLTVQPRWGSMPDRPWDSASWQADPRLIERELGWRPTRSLEHGLEDLARWFEKSPALWDRYGGGVRL
jgi:dolichol-phosphate mannosyltransferase